MIFKVLFLSWNLEYFAKLESAREASTEVACKGVDHHELQHVSRHLVSLYCNLRVDLYRKLLVSLYG